MNDDVDEFLAELLSKSQDGSIKSDGWVDTHQTFTVGHVRLSKKQEEKLLAFMLKYPSVRTEHEVSADGYSTDLRVRKFIMPFVIYFREASREEMEEACLIPGALYKEYRDPDSLDLFVLEFSV